MSKLFLQVKNSELFSIIAIITQLKNSISFGNRIGIEQIRGVKLWTAGSLKLCGDFISGPIETIMGSGES